MWILVSMAMLYRQRKIFHYENIVVGNRGNRRSFILACDYITLLNHVMKSKNKRQSEENRTK